MNALYALKGSQQWFFYLADIKLLASDVGLFGQRVHQNQNVQNARKLLNRLLMLLHEYIFTVKIETERIFDSVLKKIKSLNIDNTTNNEIAFQYLACICLEICSIPFHGIRSIYIHRIFTIQSYNC